MKKIPDFFYLKNVQFLEVISYICIYLNRRVFVMECAALQNLFDSKHYIFETFLINSTENIVLKQSGKNQFGIIWHF